MIKLGSSEISKVYLGSTEVKKIYLGGELLFDNSGSALPYDELLPSLTIVSGQTPAIITDYYPNQNTVAKCKCKITVRPTTSDNKVLFGVLTLNGSTVSKRFDLNFRNNYNVVIYTDGNGSTSSSYSLNTFYEIEVGKGYMIKNGTRTNGTAGSDFTCQYPLTLFFNSVNGVPPVDTRPGQGFVGVIEGSISFYEGSTLMRKYTPAKKDGRVGLYEEVTNQMIFSPYGEFSE